MVVKKYKEKLAHHFAEVLKSKTSPHSIALGFAIGTFISVLPTPGLNIIIGLLIIAILENINKLALFGAYVIWNPFVLVPIYAHSYGLGNMLLGSLPYATFNFVLWDTLYNFTIRFLLGNFIIAVFLSIASYGVVRLLLYIFRKHPVE